MKHKPEAREGRIKSPALWLFLAVWAPSWVLLFLDRGRTLPSAPVPRHFFVGQIVTLIFLGVLLRLSRDRMPVDHRSGLAIRQPLAETVGVVIYLFLILAVGQTLGVRPHIASAGLSGGASVAWGSQTASSVLRWAIFNFVTGVVIPLAYFAGLRRYSVRTLLLGFPAGKKWVFFCAIAGMWGVFAGDPRATFGQPLTGHLLTILLFSLGTFLPILVLFESLLAPRLAILTQSAIAGAVLSGVGYGLYHVSEFYMDWSSASAGAISLAWLIQIMFFGVAKGVSTLWTGSAWVHIFTTHTVHLTEVPEVVRVFRLR